jgi:hypothetical protein
MNYQFVRRDSSHPNSHNLAPLVLRLLNEHREVIVLKERFQSFNFWVRRAVRDFYPIVTKIDCYARWLYGCNPTDAIRSVG